MARRLYGPIKRLMDVAVSALLLVLLIPVLAAVGLAVLVTMGRPVLFRQQRPGRNGEPFEMVKFRTMRSGPGDDGDRLTAVGRFLRSTSLDELPELWNVLQGDMSLIGPRPLLMEYLPLYSDRQATRHRVRPGITGLAQVSGRNELPWDERLELDATYVERLSPIIDLRIAGQTIVKVGQRSGISAEGAATMPAFTGSAPRSTSPGTTVPTTTSPVRPSRLAGDGIEIVLPNLNHIDLTDRPRSPGADGGPDPAVSTEGTRP